MQISAVVEADCLSLQLCRPRVTAPALFQYDGSLGPVLHTQSPREDALLLRCLALPPLKCVLRLWVFASTARLLTCAHARRMLLRGDTAGAVTTLLSASCMVSKGTPVCNESFARQLGCDALTNSTLSQKA